MGKKSIETKTKRVLDDFKMPKLEESHHVLLVQETCSFENIFVII